MKFASPPYAAEIACEPTVVKVVAHDAAGRVIVHPVVPPPEARSAIVSRLLASTDPGWLRSRVAKLERVQDL